MSDLNLETRGETQILRMTRAPVNALGPDMLAQMDAIMDEMSAAPPRGGLVLSGLEKSFCAGIDTKALAGFSEAEKAAALSLIDKIMAKLYSLPIPTVAAVQGHAIGAGFIIALACDWKFLALAPGKLGLNQIAVGIKYPPVPSNIVLKEIPQPHVRRLTLGGALMTAKETVDLGLFDAALAPEELLDAAVQRAQELAAHPGFATVKAPVRGETGLMLRGLAGLD
ncbi:MAG: enoyl-CoA hydratase/isomerase family protein [Sphingomonadales bacterium]